MAKKATEKKPETVTVELKDAVSASWQATPNDHAPEGAGVIGGTVMKGKRSDTGKDGYQAVINGVSGAVGNAFRTALVSALAKQNVLPANYDLPSKWTDVHAPNKPKEINSVDDLEGDEKKLFDKGYATLEKAIGDDAKAEGNRLAAACKFADSVRAVREGFNSTQWRLFKKLAPTNDMKEFIGKNTVNEAFKASKLRATEGFDMATMLGNRVNGNKGIVSAYQSAINGVAATVAAVINTESLHKEFDIEGMGVSEMTRVILGRWLDDGGFTVGDAGNLAELGSEPGDILALWAVPLHDANIPDEIGLFEVADNKFTVAKANKAAVAGCLFGMEGDDELLAAIARALSANIVKEATAEVADAAAAMVKEARDSKTPFAQWPADRAARHLANILFTRWPEDGSESEQEAAFADIDGIVSQIGTWLDELKAGNLSVADILNPEGDEVPTDAADGEDAADAEMSE